MLQRLTRLCISRRWTVIAIWAAVLVGGFAAAPVLFSNLSTEAGVVDDSESVRASERLWRHAPSGTAAYAVVDGLAVDDPNLRSAVTSAADRLAALPGVKSVVTPWSGQGAVGSADARGVATDGRAVAMAVELKPTETGWLAVEPATELLRGIDAPEVMVGGEALLDLEMEEQAAADLAQAELFSLPVVLVLLLVVFGGVVAAGLPVLVALLGTAATLGLLAAVSAMADVSVYAVNIVTMLGLGLAVDYALLVVSRFREERVATSDLHVALLRTFATAGRTVAFSGMTVAASLAGLLAFPDDFLRSMGLAGLAVVLLAMAATLTLLPALLSLVGHRIRPARASGGGRLVRRLAGALHGRRAVAVVAVVVPLLALAALPFLQVRYAEPDERSLPASSESRRIQEMLRERFATPASSDPLTVVTETRLSRDDLAGYVKTFEGLEGVRAVTPRSTGAELTAIDVLPKGPDQGPNARALVEEIRALDLPVSAMVTGDAARLTDYEHALSSRLPVAGGIVMAATFVLLFLFTGSVVVPLKAIVMNLLSLGASFGREPEHHHPRTGLRHGVRTVDGLRDLPARPHRRGMAPNPRQPARGLSRTGRHRPHRHGRGAAHDRGLRRVRGRRVLPRQAGRLRAGSRHRRGRHHRPDAAGAGRDVTDGTSQLVGPSAAAAAAPADRTARGTVRTGRAPSSRPGGRPVGASARRESCAASVQQRHQDHVIMAVRQPCRPEPAHVAPAEVAVEGHGPAMLGHDVQYGQPATPHGPVDRGVEEQLADPVATGVLGDEQHGHGCQLVSARRCGDDRGGLVVLDPADHHVSDHVTVPLGDPSLLLVATHDELLDREGQRPAQGVAGARLLICEHIHERREVLRHPRPDPGLVRACHRRGRFWRGHRRPWMGSRCLSEG